MSVAFDLDSLLAPGPVGAPLRRPGLRVVPCEQPGSASERPAIDRTANTCGAGQLASVSVLHAPSAGAAAAPLRLTRRGTALLAVLTAGIGALVVWVAAASAPDAAASGVAHSGPATVTVRAGDTLWALASRVAPARDPRAEVAELRSLNHLADPALTPGQVLRLR